jgi:hypothetical protein
MCQPAPANGRARREQVLAFSRAFREWRSGLPYLVELGGAAARYGRAFRSTRQRGRCKARDLGQSPIIAKVW